MTAIPPLLAKGFELIMIQSASGAQASQIHDIPVYRGKSMRILGIIGDNVGLMGPTDVEHGNYCKISLTIKGQVKWRLGLYMGYIWIAWDSLLLTIKPPPTSDKPLQRRLAVFSGECSLQGSGEEFSDLVKGAGADIKG